MKLSLKRRLIYRIGQWLLKAYLPLIWRTSKIVVLQAERLQPYQQGKACIPCYWHQHNLLGSLYLLNQYEQGLNVGFLVSPSNDGSAITPVLEARGVRVIRGSSSSTGAQALKGMYELVQQGISITSTPDGPRGPLHEFKAGPLMLSKITQAPVLMIGMACQRYKTLSSWDRFVLPLPFNKIVYVIGEPLVVDRKLKLTQMDQQQQFASEQLQQLNQQAAEHLTC